LEQFAAAVEADRTAQSVPGMAVAVVQDGALQWSRGFGARDQATPTGPSMDPDTLFLAGVWGMHLTGLGVMKLVEQAKVDLDAPVTTYLPEFNVNVGTQYVPALTVRHLLNGRSGLKWGNWGTSGVSGFAGPEDNLLLDYVMSPTFSQLERIDSPPGLHFYWSNRNPMIAGMIIERASGKSYVQFMNDEVLEPLGLTRTMMREADAVADGNVAHSTINDKWTNSALARPGGMTYTTVRDMANVAEFLLKGNESFVSGATRQAVLAPAGSTESYFDASQMALAYGFTYQKLLYCPWATHFEVDTYLVGGPWNDHYHLMLLVPSKQFALIVAANTWSWDPSKTVGAAVTIILGMPPGDKATDKEDPSLFAHYVGTYRRPTSTFQFDVTPGDAGLQIPGTCDLVPAYPAGNFDCNGKSVLFRDNEQGEIEYAFVDFSPEPYVARRIQPSADAGADAAP
jgi:CubicO group peptidase (beta-lactamase class C family)